MKRSEAKWFGTLPDHWQVSTIGALYAVRNEKVSDRDYPPLSVTMKGVVPQLETAAKTDAHDDRKLVKKGDFAINSRSDRRGSCGISEYDGSVSLINTILTPRVEMNPHYYNLLFHTAEFADEFYKWGHGIVDDLWTTRWQEMKNICLPIPDLAEQETIYAFLSEKVAQIDALIANQEKQIEKLKQYKQALITEVVTKGLDPTVPMKDSGVEWIGEIPEYWETIRLKHLYDYRNGNPVKVGPFGSALPSSEIITEGVWVYNQRTILDQNFKTNNTCVSNEMASKLVGFEVSPKDILITTRGSIGKTVIVPDDSPKGILHPCVIRFRVDDRKVLRELLVLIFNETNICLGQIIDMSNSTTIEVLYSYSLKEIWMPYPPANEQKRIIDRVCRINQRFNKIIAIKQSKIEKLNQYKKSLIYEYVTGKKEVLA